MWNKSGYDLINHAESRAADNKKKKKTVLMVNQIIKSSRHHVIMNKIYFILFTY